MTLMQGFLRQFGFYSRARFFPRVVAGGLVDRFSAIGRSLSESSHDAASPFCPYRAEASLDFVRCYGRPDQSSVDRGPHFTRDESVAGTPTFESRSA
jgi:hypothetical protein